MQILDIQEAIDELQKPMTICDLNAVIKFLGQLEEEHYDQLREIEDRDCDLCGEKDNEIEILTAEKDDLEEEVSKLEFKIDGLERDIENLNEKIGELNFTISTLSEGSI